MTAQKYKMTMNLNVLQHLGLNLYSNIPAVLSEVVSNAWDADSSQVEITIESDEITIVDNGCGMTSDDINDKYLNVGYQKREQGSPITEKYKRPVMGRKGIGKLSLFSIANIIEVYSCKDGIKSGLVISSIELKDKIKNGEVEYYPKEIEESNEFLESEGTKIILKDLKKRTSNTVPFLRKRLARRFSVIGSEYYFKVLINGEPISVEDREYFHKLQYLWVYDEKDLSKYSKLSPNLENEPKLRNGNINNTDLYVKGWIGAVEKAGDLNENKENLNKIGIMVRGKLAQEDILINFSEGGLYTKYLIGEIHADFLDTDDEEDIATSSRQSIIEDDDRYIKLKEFIHSELKYIAKAWNENRKERGTEEALSIPSIKDWFNELSRSHKTKAKSLFGKINQLSLDPISKKDLFKHSVLAFESFKIKENLDEFDKVTAENLSQLTELMANFDDIEATLYHQIITERLKVINLLLEKVDQNDLEKVLQEYIFDHLWLLDPSWDRATETPVMEKRFTSIFEDSSTALNAEEAKGRFDIKYKKTSGKHIIIELKRASVKTNTTTLLSQVQKYSKSMKKILRQIGSNEPYEIICLLGQELTDWEDEDDRENTKTNLKTANARIVMYEELIQNAQIMYSDFLEQNKKAGRISRLISSIDMDL